MHLPNRRSNRVGKRLARRAFFSASFLLWAGLGLANLFGGAVLLNPPTAMASGLLLAPRFAVALDPAPDDALVALLSGIEINQAAMHWAVYGEFEFRVFGKDRLVPVSPTLRIQFQEVRYTLGMGGYVAFPLHAIGDNHHLASGGGQPWSGEARLGGGLGYSLGEYRGTAIKPESLWVPWIDIGYAIRFGSRSSLAFGYQYRPLPHTSPHRLTFLLGGLIP